MNEIVPFDFNEIAQVAKAMASSGFFQDTRQEAQAIVKVLAGREMGLGPFASMTGIHIIQGRPALGANLIASLVKNDPRYDYKVVTLTEATCSIDFFENGKPIGNSTFTAEDARKAGTKNMDKFAKNMLFARAISNGAKWYTPGIFGGAPIYTPEELGAETNEDGYIINTTFSEAPAEPTQPEATPVDKTKPGAWKKLWLDTITHNKYAKNEFEAAAMLAKSNVVTPDADLTAAIVGGWAKHYRQQRDEGAEMLAAAAYADGKTTEYLNSNPLP